MLNSHLTNYSSWTNPTHDHMSAHTVRCRAVKATLQCRRNRRETTDFPVRCRTAARVTARFFERCQIIQRAPFPPRRRLACHRAVHVNAALPYGCGLLVAVQPVRTHLRRYLADGDVVNIARVNTLGPQVHSKLKNAD